MNNAAGIEGGCLCGKVRYAITGRLSNAENCHCSMCRRQHGAAYASYADVDADEFEWRAGEDLVKVYATPSGEGWLFCAADQGGRFDIPDAVEVHVDDGVLHAAVTRSRVGGLYRRGKQDRDK